MVLGTRDGQRHHIGRTCGTHFLGGGWDAQGFGPDLRYRSVMVWFDTMQN
jgi:hypothetical protein